ncbi:uncharacterized protein LOC113293246 [Papaver somniferum]|uniref:uncharacterized protein LOC113293246 n=1 Tax=Papaver somniferum TaxID=3469 RepID=UPI000E703CA3|nr:uncharacterized protein LOC113293246 [Papaver somniferum]
MNKSWPPFSNSVSSSMCMDVFYTKCQSLRAKELYRHEEMLTILCLCGLSAEDDPLRIMILDMIPLPCLSKVEGIADDYDRLQNMGIQSKSWPEVYQQQQVIRGHGKCGNGCTYCGHTNHDVSTCYKFREYLVLKSARLYDYESISFPFSVYFSLYFFVTGDIMELNIVSFSD